MNHFISRYRAYRNASGFTLIEILIVVAIIGILASVALVGLNPVQRKGRDARRISDLRQIQTSLELYFTKNGQYPNVSTFPDLKDALTSAGIGTNNVPDDPRSSANVHYFYGTDSTNSSYVLGAQLEDTSNPVLNESIDQDTFGVACSRTNGVYCVQL